LLTTQSGDPPAGGCTVASTGMLIPPDLADLHRSLNAATVSSHHVINVMAGGDQRQHRRTSACPGALP
jgi:hypothetical protein